MRMRRSPRYEPEHEQWFIALYSVNDLSVPYMTAYVDLEDPFLNYRDDGLTVYVALQSTSIQADTHY